MKKSRTVKEEAFWISPEGIIYEVFEKHIDMMFDNPEKFGLTIEYIHSVYDRYGEKYRTEQMARKEILIELFQKGWIRVRKYLRPYRWSLNTASLNEDSIERISLFAMAMLNKGHSRQDEVIVDTPESRKTYSLEQLKNLDFY